MGPAEAERVGAVRDDRVASEAASGRGARRCCTERGR
jgi:hypothetical protein